MKHAEIHSQKVKPFAYFIILFAGIGGMLYGYDIGVISGALIFMERSIHLTDFELSTIVGSVLGGGAIATLVSGYLADRFGRRTMISVASGIFIIGVVSLILAQSYLTILISRLIQGIGVGIITIIIPLYLTETAPSSIRGRSVTVFQVFLTAGILIAFLVDLAFADSANWRGMFACVLVPGILLFIASFYLIRSPRWLYAHGLYDEALAALKKTSSDAEAALDFEEMKLTKVNENNLTLKQFFHELTQGKYRKPFLIALAIACLNQLTGINSVLQYSTFILRNTGLDSDFISMLGSVWLGLINFIVTLVALPLIDRLGRKPLLSVGTAGAMIMLFFLGTVCFLDDSVFKGTLLTCGFCIYILFYAIGPGVVVWLALSELLPMTIRSKGMAVCLFVNSTVSSILASFFLILVHHFGYQSVFFLCAVCTLLYFLLAAFVLPETKNQSLEEIEMKFQTKEDV